MSGGGSVLHSLSGLLTRLRISRSPRCCCNCCQRVHGPTLAFPSSMSIVASTIQWSLVAYNCSAKPRVTMIKQDSINEKNDGGPRQLGRIKGRCGSIRDRTGIPAHLRRAFSNDTKYTIQDTPGRHLQIAGRGPGRASNLLSGLGDILQL